MEPNISFNTYTPPPPPKGDLDIVIGIFFDGTLNNKTNTEQRRDNTGTYKKYGGDAGDNTSYQNDWSNVARLWDCYDFEKAIYVEGIGTLDKKDDETDGYAFGAEETGIKAKVKIGCERIVKKIKEVKKDKNEKVEKIFMTLDVFGFSRGSAAARNFVYETSRKLDKAKKLPKYGVLGQELEKAGIEIEVLKVRFLGIYDTVSSYSEDVWTTSPNFNNDIKELHLDDITNAKKIVHFTSDDEHREYFDLTNVAVDSTINGVKQNPVYYGIEKTFPGVHCDVGGAYENGPEVKDEILDNESTISFKERKKQLVAEGWFTDEELIVRWDKLSSERKYIKKTYSYIPLQFMQEYGTDSDLPFNKSKLEKKYSISNDALLVRVKARLKPYIMGNGKPYKFRTIESINKQYKGAKIPEQRFIDYNNEIREQKDLKVLRNKYLHWSANYDSAGYDPRRDGKRVIH